MIRFEPTLIHGSKWRVDLCDGNRKRGTFRAVPVTEQVYTLAQAQAFCNNNKTTEFKHLLQTTNFERK